MSSKKKPEESLSYMIEGMDASDESLCLDARGRLVDLSRSNLVKFVGMDPDLIGRIQSQLAIERETHLC